MWLTTPSFCKSLDLPLLPFCNIFLYDLADVAKDVVFHLKVGGAKSSGNANDPMPGVAVSGGSRIYKGGGGIK